jgi:hypothetical protein
MGVVGHIFGSKVAWTLARRPAPMFFAKRVYQLMGIVFGEKAAPADC